MDAEHFDALTRTLAGRRLVLAALATGLIHLDPVAARKRNPNHKHKHKHRRKKKQPPDCATGQRLCRGRCIANGACCSDVECLPHGQCAGCQGGQCLPFGGICVDTYGPCFTCDATRFTCVAAVEGATCGPCRFCRGGNCIGCRDLGECASCQGDECLPDGRICSEAYGPCWSCNAENFTCTLDRTPCPAGVETRCCKPEEPCCNGVCCTGVCCGGSENGYCYLDPGYICCADAAGSGCPSYDRCCGEECVDFDTYPEHCGSCFNRCRADQECVDGNCECRQAGTKNCESLGRCILESHHCCGLWDCPSDLHCCDAGCCE